MSKRELIHGLKGFTTHLQKSLNRYHQSPILLIQSQPLLDGNGKLRESKQISDVCRRVHQLLSQQLNLRTLPFHASADYPFPLTPTAPESIVQMAQRTGATTLVAVGSGQAMDLAKSVGQQFESTVLVPASYGATMVAGTSHALLLDKENDTLVPAAFDCDDYVVVTAADAAASMRTETRDTAILAAISIVLDTMLSTDQGHDLQMYQDLLKTLAANLQQKTIDETNHKQLCRSLLTAGGLASYGLGFHDRSISIGLLASLLPTSFAASDAMTLLASTVPSLHRMLCARNTRYAGLLDESHLPQVPKIVTTEPFESLLSLIHENQVAWNCIDVRDKVYRDALLDHLLA